MNNSFMSHWEPLLKLISLVDEPRLKKAMREWVNQNQNCAYSVKTGACDMTCESCTNDVTIERLIIIPDSGILSLKKEKKNAKKNLPKV